MGLRMLLTVLLLWTLWPVGAGAEPGSREPATTAPLPAALEPWSPWVLHGQDQRFCPAERNDAASRLCLFPGAVTLELLPEGARFSLAVQAYAPARLTLPHAERVWPQTVLLDGAAVAVQEQDGVPTLLLQPGAWRIQGFLPWAEVPEVLQLPAETGLVSLLRQEGPEPFPDLGPDGRLRLSGRAEEAAERPEDALQLRIYRLVRDDMPLQVTTLLRLDVSGRARRIALPRVLFADSEPLAVDSPLPLSFAPEGGLFVQARPGSFELRITSRLPGRVEGLGPSPADFGREYWSFQARDDLRVVEVLGAPGIDPKTTDLPLDWQGLPAYLMEPGSALHFREMHRGAPEGLSEGLSIARTIWLDYDGQGVSVQDHIAGQLREHWTLRMLPPGELGRATLQGRDEPVVLLGPEAWPGVELRQSALQLTAEARYEDFADTLPSTGWDREFDSVSATLHLPPGWRLFAAAGPDSVSDSWIGRWTLLDIFLCLVIVIAVVRLRNLRVGFVAFLFLLLAWQEPGAPGLVWLFLLAALGLCRLFAQSERLAGYRTGQRLALWLYAVALVSLVGIAVPFVYQQVNQGIFPQLEQVYDAGTMRPMTAMRSKAVNDAMIMPETAMEQGADYPQEAVPAPRALGSVPAAPGGGYLKRKAETLMYDPEALVQTGPGLPDWHWRTVHLRWNGPVAQDETLLLTLLSPGWVLGLSLARVLLLLLLLRPLVDLGTFRRPESFGRAGAVAAGLAALLFCGFLTVGSALAQPPIAPDAPQSALPAWPWPDNGGLFPPQTMLEELRQRLLEPEVCFPHCVSSPRLELTLDNGALRLLLEVHTGAWTAVPLPRIGERWQPKAVYVDGVPAGELTRRGEDLYLALEPGVHQVLLEGAVPTGLSFQVALPLGTRQGVVTAPGWIVQGLDPSGAIQGSLRLARHKAEDSEAQPQQQESYRIPPFFQVERSLTLGLEWEAGTVVRRVSPPGEPLHLEVPLLPGESVLSEEVRVQDGKAQLQFGPTQLEVVWQSRLARTDELVLRAPEAVPWLERWSLSPAQIWHLEFAGIAPTEQLGPDGRRRPVWRPWPGESVTVAVSRPETAPGMSMTIESAQLTQRVGWRLDENELVLRIRAAKGGRHTVALPPEAELTALTAQGRDLPLVGSEPGLVEFPVQPGVTDLLLRWRQPREDLFRVQAPTVDLRHPAVNAVVVQELPQDRWILWAGGGPLLGPAVQYWTYLPAALIFATALGFLPWTRLRRWQWFLLAVGLTQLPPLSAMQAVAWLPLLGLREQYYPEKGWFKFNVVQLVLLLVVLAGLAALYSAVERGLLGLPDMQVAGNGSTDFRLVWTQDRVAGLLPQPVIHSAPLWGFRLVMLAWSLWLAVSLFSWLRWGWDCYTRGGVLRSVERRRRPAPQQPQPAEDEFLLEAAAPEDASSRGGKPSAP